MFFLSLQCDFQVIYASGIKGKAGLSPENLAEDLGPLFESIMRCIPGPRIDKDGSLQMLVSSCLSYCFLVFYFKYSIDFILYIYIVVTGKYVLLLIYYHMGNK
jgi:hypothetical protein